MIGTMSYKTGEMVVRLWGQSTHDPWLDIYAHQNKTNSYQLSIAFWTGKR